MAPGDRATAGLLDAHRRAHAGGRRIVLGRRLPERPLSTLAARLDWLERHDAARRAAGAIAPTVADLDPGHVSLPRDLVDDLDPALPLAAAVRDVALRAEAEGVEVVVAPDAVSLTTCEPDAGALLEAARERGRADAALVRRHPEAAAVLGVGRASRIASASPMDRARPAVLAALGIVERARMRRSWWRIFAAAREAARAGAYRAAGGPLTVDRPPIPLDLLAEDRLPPPGLAPPALEVCIGSRVLGRVGPERRWHPDLAEEAAALAGTELKRIAAAAGLPLASAAATEPAAPPDDVVQLALRGVAVAPEAVRLLGAALEGARVGVVLGVGLPAGAVAEPLVVHDRRTRPGTYPLCGRPPQVALVRRSLLHGLAPTAELGGMATLLEVAERAIDEGFAVAYREVPGILPAGAERPARARGEWDRAVARGALIARRARERQDPLLFAVRGALPFAVVARRMVTTGKPSPRHWAGTAAGFAVGAVRGARASEPGAPGQPRGRRRTGSVLSWLMNGDSTHVGSPSISMSG